MSAGSHYTYPTTPGALGKILPECAPSLIKSRFFSHTTNLLTVLTFLHFEIPYMYTREESEDASSGFGLWAKTIWGAKIWLSTASTSFKKDSYDTFLHNML